MHRLLNPYLKSSNVRFNVKRGAKPRFHFA
jgi:hypothetical protein